MASSNARNSTEKERISRKRKRNSSIPGFAPTSSSTPAVNSQAPRSINVEQFAEARALEIKNMVAAITEADKSKGKRVFQTLPNHMRRRAMSHNVKRVPARLRQRALYEMHNSSSKPEGQKKKSRYHRRRPKNLLEEYTRRQRKHVWLETHIWHAKRMKMIDTWGYRLADHPNDKGYRASYRATKNNCILQDLSYYGCIEVVGVQHQIIKAMNHLTSQEAGLTFAAKYYLTGKREGHLMLYKLDQFPQGAICPVSFLWRQMKTADTTTITENMQHRKNDELIKEIVDSDNVTNNYSMEASDEMPMNENTSQLWVWCHPASFSSVFEAISEACKSVGRTSVEKGRCLPDKDDNPDQETQSCNFVNGFEHPKLRVISRRYDLLRLRLTGPESHALLTNTLKLSSGTSQKHCESKSNKNSQNNATFIKDKGDHKRTSKWWEQIQNNPSDSTAQSLLWEKLRKVSSPSVLPSGCVIGLTVHDPRLYLPGKKKNIMQATEDNDSEDSDYCAEIASAPSEMMSKVDKSTSKQPSFEDLMANWPTDVAGSHIWEEAVCREVKETKLSEQDLNRKRSALLVPGSQLDLKPDEISHIPLLLIQQPGSPGDCRDGAGYGSGWDIILPCGWAMAFWMAFVYRGARTGGLRESQTLALEQGVPFFPNDFPDTPSGQAYNENLKADGEAQYGRYPPAKRPNYDKLGIKSPFCPPWKELVEDWSLSEPDSGGKAVESTKTVDRNIESNTIKVESSSNDVSFCKPFYVLRSRSKLAALRNFVLRGKTKQTKVKGLKDFVTTTKAPLPMNNDLSAIVKEDANSLVCVLVRMVGRNVPTPNSTLAIPFSEDITGFTKCKDTSSPVEPLHKGVLARTSGKSLRNLCKREIVGFVSSGHFSLARGCGFGVGFCALPGLVKLISSTSDRGEVLVLVRSPTTQQYRFAHLTIF